MAASDATGPVSSQAIEPTVSSASDSDVDPSPGFNITPGSNEVSSSDDQISLAADSEREDAEAPALAAQQWKDTPISPWLSSLLEENHVSTEQPDWKACLADDNSKLPFSVDDFLAARPGM